MLSLSPMKILIIVAAVVLLLGPDKLPEVAHKMGSTWQSLRRFQQRIESEVRDALPDLPSTGDIARMARNPVSVLNQLADRAENPSTFSAPEEDATAPPQAAPPLVTPLVTPPTRPPSTTDPLGADPSLN
ncbi:MAG: twin-arginine translocase TatA/TatE family subunit [Acidobacteriota bacterium]|nr:twin-arginine translocase TatA/TatE family subunit [Acidobacteriota bacterium]